MGLPRISGYRLPLEPELPPVRVPWALDPSRAALLVHDMQKYFVGAYPADGPPIADVIANVGALRRACDACRIPVFFSAQRGGQTRQSRGLQADLWGPGMHASPDHEPIVDALAPAADDRFLTKHRYSAFQRTTFEADLGALGRDQLIVTGIYASIGCLLTAADAFMRDIEPFVVADAVADFSRAGHDLALTYVVERCGALTTTSRLVEELAAQGSIRGAEGRHP